MTRYIKTAGILIALLITALPYGCTVDNGKAAGTSTAGGETVASTNAAENAKAAGTGTSQDTRIQNWIDDIDYMQTNLPQIHKNLYHSIKKEDFDKAIFDLKNDVPKFKDYEIECRLAQIVASIGDAHTSLYLNFDYSSTYPLKVWWFGEDLRVIKTDREHKDILSAKLTQINGIPISEIAKKTDSLISHENAQWLKAMDPQYIMMPDVLKMFDIISDYTAEFTFTADDNSITKYKLSPGALASANEAGVLDGTPVKPLRFQYNSNNFADSLYWYKYIPEDKILYFQYNDCVDKKIARERGYKDFEKYPDFEVFSDGIIKAISENDIDKFVIDLRYNGGGDSSLFTGLAVKLAVIDKLKGKVYAMIGRETFSSAVFAAVDLMKSTDAVFYGEPTGGNVNGYGDTRPLVLPNSKMQISYSTKYFSLSDKFKENFIPDVEVNDSFNDYKNGIDDVYEAVINLKN